MRLKASVVKLTSMKQQAGAAIVPHVTLDVMMKEVVDEVLMSLAVNAAPEEAPESPSAHNRPFHIKNDGNQAESHRGSVCLIQDSHSHSGLLPPLRRSNPEVELPLNAEPYQHVSTDDRQL